MQVQGEEESTKPVSRPDLQSHTSLILALWNTADAQS